MCLHGGARESTAKKDCYKISVSLKGRRVLGVFSTARIIWVGRTVEGCGAQ